MPKIDGYKIRIRKIIPESKKNYIKFNSKKLNCYTGVSISNPFFSTEYSPIFFKWMKQTFNNSSIFIDDYFHSYNLALFSGKSENEHKEEALSFGKEVYSYITNVLQSCNFNKSDFLIYKSSELSLTPEYKNNINLLKNLYNSDDLFKLSVIESANEYIVRQKKRGHKINTSKDKAINLCVNYILCDCAIFATLCDFGYTVEAYPGPEIDVLEKIINKQIPGPQSLIDRINLEVKIERK